MRYTGNCHHGRFLERPCEECYAEAQAYRKLRAVVRTVARVAARAWNHNAEQKWKGAAGYVTILMQLGDVADGKKIPAGLKGLRKQMKLNLGI